MKNIILILVATITFISCDCHYCPICGEWKENCRCNHNILNYNNNDYFCAETLLGTWQCNTKIGNIVIKQINFFNNHSCDITYSDNIDWYTDTYIYSYSSKYIKFSRNGNTFSFKVGGYLFPELYLIDSFNKHTWRKIRAYGC